MQKKITSFQELTELLPFVQDDMTEKTDYHAVASQRKAEREENRNSAYNIVSVVAYLIGVDKRHFEDANEPPKIEIFNQLAIEKDSRIFRNLCIVRNGLEHDYLSIANAFRNEVKNINSVPEYIPSEAVDELARDGISLYKSRPDVDDYIILINIEISNRVNKIKRYFPEWINWDYIKPLFIMPKGTKKDGIKLAGNIYKANITRYPYQCWLNWDAVSVGEAGYGNILYNDEKFVRIIYERHEDIFDNLSLVRDAGNGTLRSIGEYFEKAEKCIIGVDCENSDAIKLAAALSSLRPEHLQKLSRIVLFDSEYTTPQWQTFVDKHLRQVVSSDNHDIAIEHVVVKRLNEAKSQVDMFLAVRISKEIIENGSDSVILVSSDGDYWAMLQQFLDKNFLVMLERNKTGQAITDTLFMHDIPFCYIDDFCTAVSYSIKTDTIAFAIQEKIDACLSGKSSEQLNLRSFLDDALAASWIIMTEKEKEAFFTRYLQKIKTDVDSTGTVRLTIEV